jgi:predicted outer membrane repeat protein
MGRWAWIAMGVVVPAMLASPDARACSVFAVYDDAVPADGEHPANAAVIIRGSALDPGLVAATIDGMPVTVVLDEALSIVAGSEGQYWMELALRFDPAPSPGQVVVVNGAACEDGPEICPPFGVEYVATAPDVEIVADIPSVSFDLVRSLQVNYNSCGDNGSAIFATVELEPGAFAGDDWVHLDVRAYHLAAGVDEVVAEDASLLYDATIFRLDPEMIGRAFPLDGWCIEVSSLDAAGNAGAVVTNCDACLFGIDDGGAFPDLEPIPGGPCDDGSTVSTTTASESSGGDTSTSEASTSSTADEPPPVSESEDDDAAPPSGDDETSGGAPLDDAIDRGCACGPMRSPAGDAPWWLLALVGVARRRSAHRRSRADHR